MTLDSCIKCQTNPTMLQFFFLLKQECLIELLQEMFGEEAVPKIFKGEKLYIVVNNEKANIDITKMVRSNRSYLYTRHFYLEIE